MRHSQLFALVAFAGLGVGACDAAPGVAGPEIPAPSFTVIPAGGYEAVDLGDLGGGRSSAQAINGPGAIVGWSFDAVPLQRAMYWSNGTGMMDITPPGSDQAYAQAINNHGQVAVTARMLDGTWALYLWTLADGNQLVAPFPSGGTLSVTGMNEDGDMVGRGPDNEGFRWTAANGVEPLSSVVTDVALDNSGAWDINDMGQITFRTRSATFGHSLDGYLWTPGEGSTQIFPNGYASLPREVNNSGQVAAGRWSEGYEITGHRWSVDGADATGPFDGTRTEMWGINESGQVVGTSGSFPVVWDEDEGLIPLPTPGGAYGSAYGINEAGLIVGYADGRAILWRAAVAAVSIDVKPGSATNPVNLKDRGSLPVAILSSADFDATTADLSTILLGDGSAGGTPVAEKKNGQWHASMEDVNGDGLVDAMLHFDVPALVTNGDLSSRSIELCVSGETTLGDAFQGCDVVSVR